MTNDDSRKVQGTVAGQVLGWVVVAAVGAVVVSAAVWAVTRILHAAFGA